MSESILYYPTIDIQDGAWLRSAVLYWDEVCSIVPYQNYPDLSPEVLYLERRGYYRAIFPEDVFILGDPGEFSTAVKHAFTPYLPKRKFFNIRTHKSYKTPRRKVYCPEIVSLIHYKKVPREVLKIFTENEVVEVNEDGWLEMDDFFAQRYMRLLAEFVIKCDNKGMVLGTDKTTYIREIYPRHPEKTTNNTTVSLILEKCLPIPAENVGFEELLDFKEQRRDELLSLQIKIGELEQSIAKAEDVEDIKRKITDFRRTWEFQLVRSEKLFKDQRLQFKLGSLRSFIQDAGAAAGLLQWAQSSNLLNVPSTAFGVSIGMAGLIGVGAYQMDYQNRVRADSNSSEFAYIISAKKAGLLSNGGVSEVLN